MMKTMICAALVLGAGGTALAHGPEGHGAKVPDTVYGRPGDAGKPARDVAVRMIEMDGRMLFEPARIDVRPGEQIRFRLVNAGVLDHEFLLGTAQEIDEHAEMMKAMPDMKHDDPNAKRLAPKASGDLVWHFTKAGDSTSRVSFPAIAKPA